MIITIAYWIIVIAVSGSICLKIYGVADAIYQDKTPLFFAFLTRLVFNICLLIFLVHIHNSDSGYEQGQKDAAMGKQKYTCLMDANLNKYVVEKQ